MEELVSTRFFFSLASGAGNSFIAVHAFFLSHSCCMILFWTIKALQEFFSQIFHSPPPPKIKWSTPNHLLSFGAPT